MKSWRSDPREMEGAANILSACRRKADGEEQWYSMAKRRIRNLRALVRAVFSGGRAQEAERQAELRRLRFRDGQAIPHHIAFIMDGNGRWATRRHLPRSMGHRAGVEALRRVVRLCDAYHVPMLTVYAFSTENWGRPADEVSALMGLLWETIRTDVDRLNREGVRLRHVGRLEGLDQDIQEAIHWMEDLTRANDKLELNVCFNYGGRAEIVDAVRQIVAAKIPPERCHRRDDFQLSLYPRASRSRPDYPYRRRDAPEQLSHLAGRLCGVLFDGDALARL